MSQRCCHLLLAALFLSAGSGAAGADLDSGKRAYDAGDYVTALKELTPSAEQGNADAQVLLGLMYFRGNGVSKDFGAALKWYRAAADQGSAEGRAHLASMYFMGAGVAKDSSKALELWRLSANQGNVGAQVSLVWHTRVLGICRTISFSPACGSIWPLRPATYSLPDSVTTCKD